MAIKPTLILPRDLPAASQSYPNDAMVSDDGSAVHRVTPVQIVNAGAPVPSEAVAMAGTNNTARMTPLMVHMVSKQNPTSWADFSRFMVIPDGSVVAFNGVQFVRDRASNITGLGPGAGWKPMAPIQFAHFGALRSTLAAPVDQFSKLQAAWDYASSSRLPLAGDGWDYATAQTIVVRSNTAYTGNGTRFIKMHNSSGYTDGLFRNADYNSGSVTTNLEIDGLRTVDAPGVTQGCHWVMVDVANCRFDNFDLAKTSGAWTFILAGDDVSILNPRIRVVSTEPYGDGIHITRGRRITITSPDIISVDDCIAIHPHQAVWTVNGAFSGIGDIVVVGGRLESPTQSVRIGASESSGQVGVDWAFGKCTFTGVQMPSGVKLEDLRANAPITDTIRFTGCDFEGDDITITARRADGGAAYREVIISDARMRDAESGGQALFVANKAVSRLELNNCNISGRISIQAAGEIAIRNTRIVETAASGTIARLQSPLISWDGGGIYGNGLQYAGLSVGNFGAAVPLLRVQNMTISNCTRGITSAPVDINFLDLSGVRFNANSSYDIDLARVLATTTEVTGDAFFPKMVVETAASEVSIYYKSGDPRKPTYVKWHMIYNNVPSRNCKVWRTDRAFEATRLPDGSFALGRKIVQNSEVEAAVQISGRIDFSGGYIHGNEMETRDPVWLIDGVKINPSSGWVYECDKVELVQATEMYLPGTTEATKYVPIGPVVFSLVRQSIWKDGALTIRNHVTEQASGHAVSAAFFGMVPIQRVNDEDGTTQITHTAMRSPSWGIEDVSVAGFAQVQTTADSVRIWGDRYSAFSRVLEGWTDASRKAYIDNRPAYNKIYYGFFRSGTHITSAGAQYDASVEMSVGIKDLSSYPRNPQGPSVPSLPAIAAFGDSTTASGWASNLATAGWSVPAYNFGLSSNTAKGIASRYWALECSYDCPLIPANGAEVSCAPSSTNEGKPMESWADASASINGWLTTSADAAPHEGQFVTLRWDLSTAGYYIKRYAAGEAIPAGKRYFYAAPVANGDGAKTPASTQVWNFSSMILALFIGRNSHTNPTLVLDMAKKIAAKQSANPKRFIMMPWLNGTDEPVGSSVYILRQQQLALFQAEWPDNTLDLMPALHAASDGSPADLAAIAGDYPPPSLMADRIHPNAAGRLIIAQAVSAFALQKGWRL